jgi:anti-sigma B factor antagonist
MTSLAHPTAHDLDSSRRPFLLSIDVARGRVTVHGDLDRLHVHRLLEALGILIHSPSPTWSVDASGITFCDAGGLRGLLEGQQLAHEAGRGYTVTRARPWLRYLMQLVELGAEPPMTCDR